MLSMRCFWYTLKLLRNPLRHVSIKFYLHQYKIEISVRIFLRTLALKFFKEFLTETKYLWWDAFEIGWTYCVAMINLKTIWIIEIKITCWCKRLLVGRSYNATACRSLYHAYLAWVRRQLHSRECILRLVILKLHHLFF